MLKLKVTYNKMKNGLQISLLLHGQLGTSIMFE